MRVLIIVPRFPVNAENIKGGVNSALSNLLKGFASSDINVRVLSFNREIAEPVVVKYAPNITIYYNPESRLPHILNYAYKGSALIKRHIRDFEPSIVHYAMSGYILSSKLFGLSGRVQLVTIHGMPFPEARQKETVKEKLVYYTNGIVELLLCPTNIIHISKYSQALYSNKNRHTAIIPNAINPEFFELPLKISTNNRMLYVGGISANKNILFHLQTLKRLVDKKMFFSLDVVGSFNGDKYKSEVISFIKNNMLSEFVTFHGWMPQHEVQQILTRSDILMVASKQETLPMVIAEAMSAGKVVVCSTVGGIPEMITHGEDGFLFDNASVSNVLPVFEQLYNNDVLVSRVQAKARDTALNTYHCDRVAQKTIAFYKQLVKTRDASV